MKLRLKNILVTLFFLLTAIIAGAQPVSLHGQLHVDGIQLKDKNNNPVVLCGMSFGWHNFWPRFYNAGAVDWLYKDWHCSVLRAAMGVEPANGYINRQGWSEEKIKTVVNEAIKEGIYIIIDWHSHNIRLNEASKFFTEMAKTYSGYPNVIYEIFNEPEYGTWKEVKDYSTAIIKIIRAFDPDNIILIGNPHWDQDINLVADDPITGFKNIMYTVHFYAASHKQSLRDRCDYALNKNIPIFISESAGMQASGDGAIDYDEWNRWIDWAASKRISWIIWSVSDKDETCSVLLPSAKSNGEWKEKDLKESGIKARELIRKCALTDK